MDQDVSKIARNENLVPEIDTSDTMITYNQFEYNMDTMEMQVEAAENEFEYDFESKTPTFKQYEELRLFVNSFNNKLLSMELPTTKKTEILELVGDLIVKLSTTITNLYHSSKKDSGQIVNIIDIAKDLVCSELGVYRTKYRHDKNISSRSSYIHPEERAIGTRYEMKMDPVNKTCSIPRLVQSSCQFVPITKQIQVLFENEEFKKLYLKHNAEGHECIEGKYRHFCCGEVFKHNELFRSDPYAIQIQLYTDDFEICNPLQSKAGVHKLCAVYFSIKNFPEEYQSKLNYIRLVCLCYSDDINKTTEADYNNIWQIIVEDIKILETIGIRVGSTAIRGTICWPSFDNLGANISLGFAKSFTAAYFCRFCECSSNECSKAAKEIASKVRTKDNNSSFEYSQISRQSRLYQNMWSEELLSSQ